MTFRGLIDQARFRGLDDTTPPRTMKTVAGWCGVSIPYLYTLGYGKKTPRQWTKVKIAKGLDVTVATVERALAQSRREARLLS